MLGEIRGEVRFKEPLSFHTSLRIGGPADIFVVPQDVEDIRHALMFAEREQLPVAVVGGGNNLVVRDRGIRGVVLKLEGCLGRAEYYGEEALAGAGGGLSALIREAAALNLGGIECLVGIPATIGGALAMNAGTADGSIGDFVSAVYYLHPDGSLGEFKPSGAFGYRAVHLRARCSSAAGCSSTAGRCPRSRRRSAHGSSRRRPRSRWRWPPPASSGKIPPATWPRGSSRRPGCAASASTARRSPPSTPTSSSTAAPPALPTS